MVATCRLNCSLFSNHFYSEQEFNCASLIKRPETKLEIGRVCVHRDFRKGIILMLLWRAIADYMAKTESRFLFGCGSVATEDPKEAVLLYRFLEDQNKIQNHFEISPTEKFRSIEFEQLLLDYKRALTPAESALAKNLLPPLCRSYFDIGCFTPCAPAFDRDFKCIDFLTILDVNKLSPLVRRKMLGAT
jgi:putative hemolysin